ncbi:glycosyltransferase [Winogradskyella thalassocola]|uniref:Glycosyltransferase involved in cell wall bisynthesis n=1 Tax=Winogradskyella thalassocola TaxID=262004 RepID=A0A1G7Z1H4_9FLAO|nr:glycosyltransferase [Winogradskyella thalassocola]SDH02484.1 Glycosyltransferase involved in cell wall bisynthesis [Winogradskyella thalassocola]
MDKTIVYIISPRSASSKTPGRKIGEIIKTWSKKNKVYPVFGGDLKLGVNSNNDLPSSYGNSNVHNQTYRKSLIWISLSELKDIIHTFVTLFFLKKEFNKVNVDLIWERSSRLHWAGLMYAKQRKLPYILEWKDHLIPYKMSLFKWLALFIESKKIKNATCIVVESNVLRVHLSEKYQISKDKILVALNAVEYETFARKDRSQVQFSFNNSEISNKKFVISYLGSFAFYHDSKLLVEAAKILMSKTNDIAIVMVGDGKDRQECFDLAKEHKVLNKNLFFYAPVSKELVPDILSLTDIAVLPGSTDIISPIKVMEYMSSGSVSLVPDYECNREVVKHKTTGYLFKPHNAVALSEAILDIINNPDLRAEIQKGGASYAETFLTWDLTWGLTLDKILKISV